MTGTTVSVIERQPVSYWIPNIFKKYGKIGKQLNSGLIITVRILLSSNGVEFTVFNFVTTFEGQIKTWIFFMTTKQSQILKIATTQFSFFVDPNFPILLNVFAHSSPLHPLPFTVWFSPSRFQIPLYCYLHASKRPPLKMLAHLKMLLLYVD